MGYIYDGIMGLVVGDAVGVPVEFKQRDAFEIKDMTGFGTYNQPPGTWSDDSSMTLATLDSIVQNERIDLRDIMACFASWYFRADFTPHGEVFDVGGTTRKAIGRYMRGVALEECGGRDFNDNGNGSLMRILPLAFFPCGDGDVDDVSSLTHSHTISCTACEIYVRIAKELLAGKTPEQAVKNVALEKTDFVFNWLQNSGSESRDDIKSTGFVVDTLQAALWCLLTSDSYKETILKAVNLGDDTDTVAAVAGGLAGIVYGVGGEKGIPQEWIDRIPYEEWMWELCEEAEAVRDRWLGRSMKC